MGYCCLRYCVVVILVYFGVGYGLVIVGVCVYIIICRFLLGVLLLCFVCYVKWCLVLCWFSFVECALRGCLVIVFRFPFVVW